MQNRLLTSLGQRARNTVFFTVAPPRTSVLVQRGLSLLWKIQIATLQGWGELFHSLSQKLPGTGTSNRHHLLVLGKVLQKNRTNRRYMGMERERKRGKGRESYFKELVHVTVEACQVQNLQSGLGGWRLMKVQIQRQYPEFLLTQGRSVFILFIPSTGWMWSIHIWKAICFK